jgi:nicotinamide-nucleotide amidase
MNVLQPIAKEVSELLKSTNQTLCVSESSAGGLISATLVSIPGASNYYVGGAVIYTRVAQKGLLLVEDKAIEHMRASTEEYATLNAETIKSTLSTDWALSETGASGPTGNRYGDSSGHACIAVAGPVSRSITVETGDTDREANMWVFATKALNLLRDCINDSQSA